MLFFLFKDPPEGRRSGDGPTEWLFCHFCDSIVPWGGGVSVAGTEGPVKVQTNVESHSVQRYPWWKRVNQNSGGHLPVRTKPKPHHWDGAGQVGGTPLRFCNMTEPQWVCSEDRSSWMVLAASLIYVYVCIYKHFAAVIAASGASTKHRIEGPALVQIWYSPFPL